MKLTRYMFIPSIISIVIFQSILFSQTNLPDRVVNPVKDQFHHQILQERNTIETSTSRSDFQRNHRTGMDKRKLINGDNQWQVDTKRPMQPFMSNKTMTDSTWRNGAKEIRTYDANGNMTEELWQWWDNDVWGNGQIYTYVYDANGNMTEELHQYWENNAWWNTGKDTYTFDINGNRTEYLEQDWQENDWRNIAKCTYTYDANGYMSEELWPRWENNAWVNNGKHTYTYDANGNLTEKLHQRWENTYWWNTGKDTYTYDANGNITEWLDQNFAINVWVNYHQHVYTYDTNGNMTELLEQYWDNDAWVNNWRYTYTYDTNGNMTELLDQYWFNDAWVNNRRYIYTHDANGNITEWLEHSEWDGNNWIYNFLWTNIYNTEGYVVEETLPTYLPWGTVPTKKSYLYDLNWNIIEITQQYNEEYTGLAVEQEISQLPYQFSIKQNYPNPFNPTTTIQYELPQRSDVQITIFDLMGREVTTLLSETLEAGLQSVQWDATRVPSGMYFYQIRAGDFVQTKKMILLK